MTGEQWARVRELFHEAVHLADGEQAAFLDRACAGETELRTVVESLLDSYAPATQMLEPPPERKAAISSLLADFADRIILGDIVGRYRLLEWIGAGGMGSVYRGGHVDDEHGRPVAIKLIRRGLDTHDIVLRFHRERSTLANLQHKHIAALIDGGETGDGLPFFVMEYVAGRPIDKYCDEEKLTVEQRLALVLKICDAVQYAHRNLIIHRDLKPSNILVTAEGVPKLLDFGLAKLIHHDPGTDATQTVTGLRMMTPQYTSPETYQGKPATTACDVYSIGVVLYELLTGRRPYDLRHLSPAERERTICEVDPPAPSASIRELSPRQAQQVADRRQTEPNVLHRVLRGDLDTIVMTALHKDAHRRYGSVEKLAHDIKCHIRGIPIVATQDSLGYRAYKFARRHKFGVVSISLLALSLIGGIIGTTIGLMQARRESAKASHINAFLQEMLASAAPEVGSKDVTVREVLDIAAQDVEERLGDTPDVHAAVLQTVGKVYCSLSLYDRAVEHLQESLAIRQELYGDTDAEVADTLDDLARSYRLQGDFDKSMEAGSEALAVRRRLFGERHSSVAASLYERGNLYRATGDWKRAEPTYREALDIQRELYGDYHTEVAKSLNQLCAVQIQKMMLSAAEKTCQEALHTCREVYPSDHPDTAQILSNMGILRRRQGRAVEAEPFARDALAMRQRLYGEDHSDVAESYNNVAITLVDLQRLDEAESAYHQALEIYRHVYDNEHPEVATALGNLGIVYYYKKDFDAADKNIRESLAIRRKTLSPGHPHLAASLGTLATVLYTKREYAKAEPFAREALAIREQSLSRENPHTIHSVYELARLLTHLQKTDEAEELALDCYRRRLAQFGPRHRDTIDAIRLLVQLYEQTGQTEEAQAYRDKLPASKAPAAPGGDETAP